MRGNQPSDRSLNQAYNVNLNSRGAVAVERSAGPLVECGRKPKAHFSRILIRARRSSPCTHAGPLALPPARLRIASSVPMTGNGFDRVVPANVSGRSVVREVMNTCRLVPVDCERVYFYA